MSFFKAPKDCVERYEKILSKFFDSDNSNLVESDSTKINESDKINESISDNSSELSKLDKLDEFKKVLKSCNAYCAGGSVLASIVEDEKYKGDIDIYVNVKNVVPLRNFLVSLKGLLKVSKRATSNYTNFFLDINNIKRIIRFQYEDEKSIDLVYIGNERTVESVVTNFDFTCCQNWYDSENIYSTDYELTKKKITVITKDFYPFFANNNKYTFQRIAKYQKKGFKFSIDYKMDALIKERKKLNPKEYLFKELFKWCFDPDYNNRYYNFKKYKDRTVYDKDIFIYQKIFYNDSLEPDDFKSLKDYEKFECKDILMYNVNQYLNLRNFNISKYTKVMVYLIEKYIT